MSESKLLDCGHPASPHSDFTTGYGIDSNGLKHCYDCCAETEREFMRKNGKNVLYLARYEDGYYVTDWTGYLKIKCSNPKTGRHNIARVRYDVWFMFNGQEWHGVQYGDFTQLCHCNATKS